MNNTISSHTSPPQKNIAKPELQNGSPHIPGATIPVALLESVSILYIFLPIILFLLGWVRFYYALPLIIAIFVACYWVIRDTWKGRQIQSYLTIGSTKSKNRLMHFILFLICALFIVCSPLGFSQQLRQYSDFLKHQAFLYDFSNYKLPVFIENWGYLNTYLAYYLPAAFIGRLLNSWTIACMALFIWTVFGLYLANLWLIQILKKFSWINFFLFFGFGGLDILGIYLLNVHLHFFWPSHWWVTVYASLPGSPFNGNFWHYVSNNAYFFTAPHHVLPGLIVLFLTLYYALQKKKCAHLFFIFCAMPVSSAFVAIGLMPYVIFCLLRTRLNGLFTLQNFLVAPPVFLLGSLFIISNNGEYAAGPIWKFVDLPNALPGYLLILFLEFGLFIILALFIKSGKIPDTSKCLIGLACISLGIFSLWRMGKFSDFTTKCSYPSQIVLLISYLFIIGQAKGKKEKRRASILLTTMVIACWSSLHLLTLGAYKISPNFMSSSFSTTRLLCNKELGTGSNLFSDGKSFFWKHIAKVSDLKAGQNATTPSKR